MLKPRNIIIIFLAMLFVISAICCILEANLVSNCARTATTYVQIAAECALKSATMTDEFFTSGTSKSSTYATGLHKTQSSLSGTDIRAGSSGMLIDLGAGFERDEGATNIYALTFGLSNYNALDSRVFAHDAYKAMFTTESFQKWANSILDKVYNKTASFKTTLSTRPVLWSDTFQQTDPLTGVHWYQSRGTVYVPKLLTMGTSLFTDEFDGAYRLDGDTLFDNIFDTNAYQTKADPSNGTVQKEFGSASGNMQSMWLLNNIGANGKDKAEAILSNADYWDYKRTTTIHYELGDFSNGGASEKIDFYYTPTSLGLTYIDQDMLNILFRSNLDLLMRAGFLEDGHLNAGYEADISDGYYDHLDDAALGTATWGDYAVNNGQFYYFRGKPHNASSGLTYRDMLNRECIAPQIEYYYFPVSDGKKNPTNQSTTKTINSLSSDNSLKNVIYRAIDASTSIQSLYDNYNSGNDTKTYEMVIAKVTFYADFIYPFKTSTLRGMSHWWGNAGSGSAGTISEQDSLSMGITRTKLNDLGITPDPNTESVLDGCYQYKYTCYYAIAV